MQIHFLPMRMELRRLAPHPSRSGKIWEQTILIMATVLVIELGRGQPGSWQVLLQNAGIASMHTTVTQYDNVVFLDRTNIGPSQIDLNGGRCRDNPMDRVLNHDCTAHSVIFTPGSNTVRPLFVYTDTWCSSGFFLPNGTLLQTGGDFDGNSKARMFTPCPSNGACDWEELDQPLQAGRWYATNQLLPDGRVIVVGGRDSATFEFIPNNGQGPYGLDFINQIADAQNDNLYPFVHLLPDNNLFIFANRNAILLNYFTNTVLRWYPTIPGEPRNYPSAGSSVMLPLDNGQNYSVAEIVVCGGAQEGAYLNPAAQLPASDSCGRIVATDPSSNWAMSTMPIRRNMGDMVLLPTGEVIIINGAQNGSQGWGQASNAALSPVIYDPQSGNFEVQAATTIARVYHSTANLLPDGRILVAGSNTHQFYTLTGDFPTELRVEAFSPWYLNPSNDFSRPSFVTYPNVLRYGIPFSVSVSVPSPITGDLELTLSSAPFTTHSFAQGQRQLKLPVSTPFSTGQNTYTVNSIAPPTAVVAPPTFYMLFALHGGIPSAAIWVQLTF
eukprot:c22165_g1_i1 orf=648-2309(+)